MRQRERKERRDGGGGGGGKTGDAESEKEEATHGINWMGAWGSRAAEGQAMASMTQCRTREMRAGGG